jgi:hypothetical protein
LQLGSGDDFYKMFQSNENINSENSIHDSPTKSETNVKSINDDDDEKSGGKNTTNIDGGSDILQQQQVQLSDETNHHNLSATNGNEDYIIRQLNARTSLIAKQNKIPEIERKYQKNEENSLNEYQLASHVNQADTLNNNFSSSSNYVELSASSEEPLTQNRERTFDDDINYGVVKKNELIDQLNEIQSYTDEINEPHRRVKRRDVINQIKQNELYQELNENSSLDYDMLMNGELLNGKRAKIFYVLFLRIQKISNIPMNIVVHKMLIIIC